MRTLLIIIIFFAFNCNNIISQVNDYWKNAKADDSKIYTIHHLGKQISYAVSYEGDLFKTTDGGRTWKYESDKREQLQLKNYKILWSGDIYCAIMHTTDGGLNWEQYDKEKQEHFCKVYLKDENTGYKVAYEFLCKVFTKIFTYNRDNAITILINYPQQCTEYFNNEKEGWALGWCLKDFRVVTVSSVFY
ncbi:MAG: hypothetical protein KGZ85_14290 [Ignavibacterium sp.]|nr:hypothetical protein [Ignavibacterium sp.]